MSKDTEIRCTAKGCGKVLAWYEKVHQEPPHLCWSHRWNAGGYCAEAIFGGRGLHRGCANKIKVTAADGFGYCAKHDPERVERQKRESQDRDELHNSLRDAATKAADAYERMEAKVLAALFAGKPLQAADAHALYRYAEKFAVAADAARKAGAYERAFYADHAPSRRLSRVVAALDAATKRNAP